METCVMCGDPIPEGRQVCPKCERLAKSHLKESRVSRSYEDPKPYRELMAGVIQQAVDDWTDLCEMDLNSHNGVSFVEIRKSVKGILGEYLLELGIDPDLFLYKLGEIKMRVNTARNTLLRNFRPTEILSVKYAPEFVHFKCLKNGKKHEFIWTEGYGLYKKYEKEASNEREG